MYICICLCVHEVQIVNLTDCLTVWSGQPLWLMGVLRLYGLYHMCIPVHLIWLAPT